MKIIVTKANGNYENKETKEFDYDGAKKYYNEDLSILEEYMNTEDIGLLQGIFNEDIVDFIGDDFVCDLDIKRF